MTTPGNDEALKAKHRAEAMEASLEQAIESQHHIEHLMEMVEDLARDLFQLAQDWEKVDPQRAERVRLQETQIRALGGKLERLSELEAAESKEIIADIRKALREAQGAH